MPFYLKRNVFISAPSLISKILKTDCLASSENSNDWLLKDKFRRLYRKDSLLISDGSFMFKIELMTCVAQTALSASMLNLFLLVAKKEGRDFRKWREENSFRSSIQNVAKCYLWLFCKKINIKLKLYTANKFSVSANPIPCKFRKNFKKTFE